MLFGGSWRWDSQDAMLKALMLGWLWFHSHWFYLILSDLSARLPIIDELLLGLWPTGVWAGMGLILCLRYVLLAIVGRSLATHKLRMPQLLWSLISLRSLLSTGGGLASIVMAIHPCKAFCFAVCVVAAATNRGRTRWEGMRWRLLAAQSRWQFCKTAQKASKMNECVWLDIP